MERKKLDTGQFGTDSSDRRNPMLASLVMAVQKEKTRYWEAY
jgi:hypothetical protein